MVPSPQKGVEWLCQVGQETSPLAELFKFNLRVLFPSNEKRDCEIGKNIGSEAALLASIKSKTTVWQLDVTTICPAEYVWLL